MLALLKTMRHWAFRSAAPNGTGGKTAGNGSGLLPPREMTGLFAQLSEEQRKRALSYRGVEASGVYERHTQH